MVTVILTTPGVALPFLRAQSYFYVGSSRIARDDPARIAFGGVEDWRHNMMRHQLW